MDINTRYSVSTANMGTNIASSKNKNINFMASTEEKKNIENAGNKNPEIWEELSNEYDIRNSSFDELCDISERLYQAGQISLFDHGMLTFDPSKSPQPIKPNLCLTEANAEGKRDWIAEYEARSARDLKMSNMMGYKANKNTLGILERLQ